VADGVGRFACGDVDVSGEDAEADVEVALGAEVEGVGGRLAGFVKLLEPDVGLSLEVKGFGFTVSVFFELEDCFGSAESIGMAFESER
jgi:hypothetical protein